MDLPGAWGLLRARGTPHGSPLLCSGGSWTGHGELVPLPRGPPKPPAAALWSLQYGVWGSSSLTCRHVTGQGPQGGPDSGLDYSGTFHSAGTRQGGGSPWGPAPVRRRVDAEGQNGAPARRLQRVEGLLRPGPAAHAGRAALRRRQRHPRRPDHGPVRAPRQHRRLAGRPGRAPPRRGAHGPAVCVPHREADEGSEGRRPVGATARHLCGLRCAGPQPGAQVTRALARPARPSLRGPDPGSSHKGSPSALRA